MDIQYLLFLQGLRIASGGVFDELLRFIRKVALRAVKIDDEDRAFLRGEHDDAFGVRQTVVRHDVRDVEAFFCESVLESGGICSVVHVVDQKGMIAVTGHDARRIQR